MKVVLLAGGFGTRISEESGIRPKPMVEIGGRRLATPGQSLTDESVLPIRSRTRKSSGPYP